MTKTNKQTPPPAAEPQVAAEGEVWNDLSGSP